jgi:hypothetical protein
VLSWKTIRPTDVIPTLELTKVVQFNFSCKEHWLLTAQLTMALGTTKLVAED